MISLAIVGSGPYALSLAAHLNPLGVDYRIFGPVMEAWDKHMPPGMFLKSDGFASDLYAPGEGYRLEQYCRENGIPYAHVGPPVRRTNSTEGRPFQASGSGSLFEMTTESSGFSTSGIPDSTFAIPAGFQKVERK